MPALLALIDAVGRCVPVTGVAAVGFSNGGLMANALACRAARRVRAIVLVASGYEGLGRCAPAAPVSVLAIHGTSDQVVGYRGLRAFLDTWARRDRCAPRPTARREVEGITHLRWHGCAAGAQSSTCASPATPTAGRRSRTPTSAWSASCARWADARARSTRAERTWTDGGLQKPQSARPRTD